MTWLEGWDNRLELTIDHERTGEELTDFPVLISLASGTGLTNFDAGVVFDELTQVSGTLFQDDFSTGGDNWTDILGTADYTNNFLNHTSDAERARTTSSSEYGVDWTITFKIIQSGRASLADQLYVYPIYPDDGGSNLYLRMHTYSVSNQYLKFYDASVEILDVTKYNWWEDYDTWYSVKIVRSGNLGKIKIWKTSESEPSWDWEGTFSSTMSTKAHFDFYTVFTASSGTGLDDVLIVRPLSSTKKIAVTDYIGNQLYVEIENWSHLTERANLWTKVPTILSGTDTTLYLYYDKNHADNDVWVDDTGFGPALDVWEDNFVGVWHLSGIPDNTAASLKDSTNTGNHGTSVAMDSASDSIVDGKFVGINTDGVAEYVQCGNDSTLRLTSNFTGEIVFKTTDLTSDSLIAKTDSGNTLGWGFKLKDTPELYLGFKINNSNYTILTGPTAFSTSNYYYIGISYAGDGSDPVVVVNNWLENLSTAAHVGSGGLDGITDSNQNFEIGQGNIFTGSPSYHTGPLIETRFSNTTRSAAWMKATYYTTFDKLISYTQGAKPVFTASGTVTVDTVLTDDIPVRLYRRSTGELVGATVTASGGIFEVITSYDELHYITAIHTTSGTNAVIFDWIAP